MFQGILDLSYVYGQILVIVDEDKEALKGEYISQDSSVRSQPLDGKRDLSPSSYFRIYSWSKKTLMDDLE
jgi:hypothetical protein